MKRIETKKIALASLLCALSVVISVIGCIFDMVDLTACTAASVLVALSDNELGGKYPYLVYAVTGMLLFLLFPTTTVTLFFILFFGYYPIIKKFIEKLPKIPAFILKFAVFNCATVFSYYLMTYILLSAEVEEGKAILITAWIFANIFFVAYDLSLGIFMTAYRRYYRKKWGIDKFLLH